MPRLQHQPVSGIETLYAVNLGEFAEEPKRNCPAVNQGLRDARLNTPFDDWKGGTNWFGGIRNWKEAADILEKGWSKGAERLRSLAGKLSAEVPQAKSIRRRLNWSDGGDEVCKDRLNNGQSDSCWRTMRRTPGASPQTVAIETDFGGNCHLTADDLFWQGAAAAVLTDVLEEAGYRVEMYANTKIGTPSGLNHWIRIKVKEADMPLRLDGVASVLCHAGIFRTYGVLCLEQADFPIGKRHGCAVQTRKDETDILNGGVDSIHIGTINSERQAVEMIQKFVQRGDRQ
jgi:hypothetical protein